MAAMWARWIVTGRKTLAECPEYIRPQVIELLKAVDYPVEEV